MKNIPLTKTKTYDEYDMKKKWRLVILKLLYLHIKLFFISILIITHVLKTIILSLWLLLINKNSVNKYTIIVLVIIKIWLLKRWVDQSIMKDESILKIITLLSIHWELINLNPKNVSKYKLKYKKTVLLLHYILICPKVSKLIKI